VALELRTLPIDHLTPADYNPRTVLKPNSPAYRKLRKSVETFGLVEPLVWNERTGRVVGGHARLRILRDLGWTEVPVSVVRLDEAGEKALNVVLNNREAQARFDPDKLAAVLTELLPLAEYESTGFDAGTARGLLLEPLPPEEPAAERDRVEVVLVTTSAGFDRLTGELDALIRRHDLESHVSRG
jgi:ParB-like chromosome segregation protein Spo0J